MASSDSTQRRELSGWAAFAGVVMFIVGSLDALWGLGGILNDDIVIVGGKGAIVADITTWGWVHLILGSIIALTGLGILAGNSRGAMARGPVRRNQRSRADRVVPGRAAVGVPDHRARRDDHLPADCALERSIDLVALRG